MSDIEVLSKINVNIKPIGKYKARKIFSDDDSSEDDNIVVKPIKKPSPIIGNRPIIDYLVIDANRYDYKDWNECFPKKNVILRKLVFNTKWDDFFDLVSSKPYYDELEKNLSECLKNSNNKIIPKAELVFNAFNTMEPNKIKIVVLGQDPFPGSSVVNDVTIDHATGIAFSSPINCPTPKSSSNFFLNLKKFGLISEYPKSGCLSSLAMQGVFFVNAALTALHGIKNSHKNLWNDFIGDLIDYLTTKYNNLVFIVWGKDANNMCKYINPSKHFIITSSHPSFYSCDKTTQGFEYGPVVDEQYRNTVTYPSFNSINHFGRANEWLKMKGKSEIFMDCLELSTIVGQMTAKKNKRIRKKAKKN